MDWTQINEQRPLFFSAITLGIPLTKGRLDTGCACGPKFYAHGRPLGSPDLRQGHDNSLMIKLRKVEVRVCRELAVYLVSRKFHRS